jgi:hypothetical protein
MLQCCICIRHLQRRLIKAASDKRYVTKMKLCHRFPVQFKSSHAHRLIRFDFAMAALADSGNTVTTHMPGASTSRAPNQVAVFLKSLNLQKYIDVFAANDIDDISSLNEMQDSHFRVLGVSLGHQFKIVKHIRSGLQSLSSESPLADSSLKNKVAASLDVDDQPDLNTDDLNSGASNAISQRLSEDYEVSAMSPNFIFAMVMPELNIFTLI